MMTVTRGGKSHRVYKTTYLFERKQPGAGKLLPTSRLEKITAAAKQAKLDLDRDRASAALPPAPAAAGLASGVAATGPAGLAPGAAATGPGPGPAASDTAASAAPAADPPTESPLTSATPMLEISTNVVIATYDSAGRFDWWCGRVQQMLCKSGGKRGSYVRTYLPVPFDEAKAANYKIHCNFYAKSGAEGVYTFKYNVDDSAPYHMESVLGLLDLNLPTDEGVYVPRDQQAGWKFDEALKLITPAADSAPHRKRARSTADDEAGGSSGAKKRALTVTLKRKGGTLGISVDPNNHQITNVVEGGAGDTAGLCVGDFIAEVNGKSTTGGSFGKLLPAAAMAEIRLRLIRVQVVDPGHLHLPLRA